MTLKQRIGAWLIPRMPVTRRTFDILRFEFHAFRTRVLARLHPGTRQRVNKYRQQRDLRVNLGGAGDQAAGWINVDVRCSDPRSLRWDIRRRLPFTDGSALQVYASHVVEHLDFREDVPSLFKEVFRILQPGGSFRIVVPDVVRYLDAYMSGDDSKWRALGVDELPDDMPTQMVMINHVFHQGGEHLFGYDFQTLSWLLSCAGFAGIQRCGFRRSSRFELCLDLPVHAPYSLYVEALKP